MTALALLCLLSGAQGCTHVTVGAPRISYRTQQTVHRDLLGGLRVSALASSGRQIRLRIEQRRVDEHVTSRMEVSTSTMKRYPHWFPNAYLWLIGVSSGFAGVGMTISGAASKESEDRTTMLVAGLSVAGGKVVRVVQLRGLATGRSDPQERATAVAIEELRRSSAQAIRLSRFSRGFGMVPLQVKAMALAYSLDFYARGSFRRAKLALARAKMISAAARVALMRGPAAFRMSERMKAAGCTLCPASFLAAYMTVGRHLERYRKTCQPALSVKMALLGGRLKTAEARAAFSKMVSSSPLFLYQAKQVSALPAAQRNLHYQAKVCRKVAKEGTDRYDMMIQEVANELRGG